MPTARERLLELSAIPSGNSARQHITNTVSSIVLVPEQGEIVSVDVDEEILSSKILLNQVDEEIIELEIESNVEVVIIEDQKDDDTVQECC